MKVLGRLNPVWNKQTRIETWVFIPFHSTSSTDHIHFASYTEMHAWCAPKGYMLQASYNMGHGFDVFDNPFIN